jgi:hypothetical protein
MHFLTFKKSQLLQKSQSALLQKRLRKKSKNIARKHFKYLSNADFCGL